MFAHNARLDMPELLYTDTKPVSNVKIDSQDELSEKLSVYMIFNDLAELAEGREGSLGGGATITPDGAFFDGITGYLTVPNVQIDNNFTITWAVDFISNPGGAALSYFLSYNGFSSLGSINAILVGGNNKIKIWGNNSSDGLSLFSTTEYPAINNKIVSLVIEGTTAYLYVNGALESSTATFGTSAMPNGTKSTLYLGGRSDLNSLRFANCFFDFLSVHRSALSSEVVSRYHDGLYQLLIPAKS
jgi:hypothetical protein